MGDVIELAELKTRKRQQGKEPGHLERLDEASRTRIAEEVRQLFEQTEGDPLARAKLLYFAKRLFSGASVEREVLNAHWRMIVASGTWKVYLDVTF